MELSATLGMVHGILEGWLEQNDIKEDPGKTSLYYRKLVCWG